MSKLLSLVLFFCFASFAMAQTTQYKLKKYNLDKFVASPLDDLLDTLSVNYKLKIVFERDSLHQFDVVDHFFNEPIYKVLDLECNKFNLHC